MTAKQALDDIFVARGETIRKLPDGSTIAIDSARRPGEEVIRPGEKREEKPWRYLPPPATTPTVEP